MEPGLNGNSSPQISPLFAVCAIVTLIAIAIDAFEWQHEKEKSKHDTQ